MIAVDACIIYRPHLMIYAERPPFFTRRTRIFSSRPGLLKKPLTLWGNHPKAFSNSRPVARPFVLEHLGPFDVGSDYLGDCRSVIG